MQIRYSTLNTLDHSSSVKSNKAVTQINMYDLVTTAVDPSSDSIDLNRIKTFGVRLRTPLPQPVKRTTTKVI